MGDAGTTLPAGGSGPSVLRGRFRSWGMIAAAPGFAGCQGRPRAARGIRAPRGVGKIPSAAGTVRPTDRSDRGFPVRVAGTLQ